MPGIERHIIERLPHGPEFRFLTRVVGLEDGRAVGEWSIGGGEDFLKGHFPGDPVVPGVLVAEALAQLSGLAGGACGAARLAHVDVRFDGAAVPPADIVLRSTLTRRFGSLLQFEVEACVGNQRIARGTLVLSSLTSSGAGR